MTWTGGCVLKISQDDNAFDVDLIKQDTLYFFLKNFRTLPHQKYVSKILLINYDKVYVYSNNVTSIQYLILQLGVRRVTYQLC